MPTRSIFPSLPRINPNRGLQSASLAPAHRTTSPRSRSTSDNLTPRSCTSPSLSNTAVSSLQDDPQIPFVSLAGTRLNLWAPVRCLFVGSGFPDLEPRGTPVPCTPLQGMIDGTEKKEGSCNHTGTAGIVHTHARGPTAASCHVQEPCAIVQRVAHFIPAEHCEKQWRWAMGEKDWRHPLAPTVRILVFPPSVHYWVPSCSPGRSPPGLACMHDGAP